MTPRYSVRERAIIDETYACFIIYANSYLTESELVEAAAWQSVVNGAKKAFGYVKSGNDALAKLRVLAQKTQPVQNFDAAADNLINNAKTKLGANFPKVAGAMNKYVQWAKKNPVKQAFVIGMITAVVAAATGPIGGAVAGQILRAGNELMKGEKASTAIFKGAKTGALGAIAGMGIHALGDMLANAASHVQLDKVPGVQHFLHFRDAYVYNGQVLARIDVLVTDDQANQLQAIQDQLQQAWKQDNYAKVVRLGHLYDKLADTFYSPEYIEKIQEISDNNDQLVQQALDHAKSAAATFRSLAKSLVTATQATIAGAGAGAFASADKKAIGGIDTQLQQMAAQIVKGGYGKEMLDYISKLPGATPA
jgi:hypothetical protein